MLKKAANIAAGSKRAEQNKSQRHAQTVMDIDEHESAKRPNARDDEEAFASSPARPAKIGPTSCDNQTGEKMSSVRVVAILTNAFVLSSFFKTK